MLWGHGRWCRWGFWTWLVGIRRGLLDWRAEVGSMIMVPLLRLNGN